MFIGVGRFEVFIPESGSLKDKRHLLRTVTTTVHSRFRVAIAEVDHQDLWQRATFGVSCVADSATQCRKVLQEVEKAIGRAAINEGAEIISHAIDIISEEDLA